MLIYFIEIFFRTILGLQLVFWGLNGFFAWIKIPPSDPIIDDFVTACYNTKFIMPTVKIFEIFFGSLLVAGCLVPLSLAALSPIVFVITGLHVGFNKKRRDVLVPFSLPYFILILIHFSFFAKFLSP